jgi:hypothetical protein
MGFATEGIFKAAYNHFDSYPDYLGKQVFEWALSADLEDAKAKLKVLEDIDENEQPTPEQIERLKLAGFTASSVSTGGDWFAWLRDCQGDPERLLNSGYIPNNTEFGKDALFCEWAYVVDLDLKVIEVYCGYSSVSSPRAGRWAEGGVNLVLTVPLDGSVTVEQFIEQADAAGRS